MKNFFHKLKTIYLFRTAIFISIFLHFSSFAAYYNSLLKKNPEVDSKNINASEIDFEEFPPELIGGNSSPTQKDRKDWIEGEDTKKPDPIDEDIDINAVSGNGIDKDGYLISFNGDKVPTPIIDFDLKNYFPPAAKAAGITKKEIIILIQVDETGKLNSAKIVSGKAGYGFDEAALLVVNRARYSPGYLKGKTIKMLHRMPLTFTLQEEEWILESYAKS